MAHLLSLRADAAAELKGLLMDFQPGADRATVLRDGEEIVLQLHVVAAATLLTDGNAQGFFLNLCRMAENWRRLIALLRSRNLEPPSARRNMPLLAALAAGHSRLADALATASATPRQRDDYEGEYLWACILQALARRLPLALEGLEPLIERLEVVGAEKYGHYCRLARALLGGDARAFAESFAGAQLEYAQTTEKRAREFGTPVTSFAPHRFLWLEGLALLRLAERAGLAPGEDYLFCPPLARLTMTVRYEGDWAIPGAPLE